MKAIVTSMATKENPTEAGESRREMKATPSCQRPSPTQRSRIMKQNPNPKPVVACLLAALCVGLPFQALAFSEGTSGLRVMTYNVDEGTDYLEVANAHTVTEFLLGVGQIIANVRTTNPPARMQAVARQ